MGVLMIILERHQALGTIKACPHGYGTASSGLTVGSGSSCCYNLYGWMRHVSRLQPEWDFVHYSD